MNFLSVTVTLQHGMDICRPEYRFESQGIRELQAAVFYGQDNVFHIRDVLW